MISAAPLPGLMQDRPLLISSLLNYAATYHPRRPLVTRTVEGAIHRYTYADVARRSAQLARALLRLGLRPSDRVGTLAWNTYRHFELFYAVSGLGAVLHTVNPRLFEKQITFIINHGEDRFLFVDRTFLPLVARLASVLETVEAVVVLGSRGTGDNDDVGTWELLYSEELIAAESAEFDWPTFDERSASALCYTSGTTGDPKGVLYHHRSTVLHALGAAQKSAMNLGCDDCIMSIAPLYHANGWGMPYLATLTGAKLVMPGPRLDAENIIDLINDEHVTFTCGVPTVWTIVLAHLRKTGGRIDSLNRTTIGGSAVSRAMIDELSTYGVRVLQLWGMTELSPLGTVATPTPDLDALPFEERARILAKQGRGQYGVELKITGRDGENLPRDGESVGPLWVRGPWIASAYYKRDGEPLLDANGWFPTGDVATIDAYGYLRVTDRIKDMIKSGGEWISSIELENAAAGHPKVELVAVIGVAHPKWEERPLMIVQCAKDQTLTHQEMLEYLANRVARWWMPDALVTVDAIPLTATGKVLKSELRLRFRDFALS